MRKKILLVCLSCLFILGCSKEEYVRQFPKGKRVNENVKGKWVFGVNKGNRNLYFGIIKDGIYKEIKNKDKATEGNWSFDGEYFAVFTFDKIIIYTDELEFVKEIDLKYPKGYRASIKDLIWLPDGRLMYSISKNNLKTNKAILFVYKMDVWTEEKTEIFRKENVSGGKFLDFRDISPDGKKILYEMSDNWTYIMDIDGKNSKKIYKYTNAGFLDNENIFLETNRAKDGEELRKNSYGQIRVWNLKKGKITKVIEKDRRVTTYRGKLTPDRKYLYYPRTYIDGQYICLHKLAQRKEETEIVVTYPEINETEHIDEYYLLKNKDGEYSIEWRVNVLNPEEKYPELMARAKKQVKITKEKHYTTDSWSDVWYSPEDMGYEYGEG